MENRTFKLSINHKTSISFGLRRVGEIIKNPWEQGDIGCAFARSLRNNSDWDGISDIEVVE